MSYSKPTDKLSRKEKVSILNGILQNRIKIHELVQNNTMIFFTREGENYFKDVSSGKKIFCRNVSELFKMFPNVEVQVIKLCRTVITKVD